RQRDFGRDRIGSVRGRIGVGSRLAPRERAERGWRGWNVGDFGGGVRGRGGHGLGRGGCWNRIRQQEEQSKHRGSGPRAHGPRRIAYGACATKRPMTVPITAPATTSEK